MASEPSPAVERRRLALELRRLRTEAGKTIYDVAEHLECSAGKISRIEMGVVGARIQDVREMLDLYGVRGRPREQLLDLVRRSRRRAWWHDYAGVVPADSARFFGLEDGAATIDEHSVTLVPGLLQTEAYARAVIGSASGEKPEAIDQRIELRMRRQRLLETPEPPTVRMVLHEAVLEARFGEPEVMTEQLHHLAEVAERPNVTLRVMSTSRCYTAMGVPFVAFGFAHAADPRVVYLEQLTRNTFIEAPDEVAVYTTAFEEAFELASPPDESRQLILERAGATER